MDIASHSSHSMQGLPATVHLNGNDVVRLVMDWYSASGRRFAWRASPQVVADAVEKGDVILDPYVVLVSEVMLQQTQTSRVALSLPRFLTRFPTVLALAAASRADVLREWSGLGYNSRALRLHDASRDVAERHRGKFPRDIRELRALAGIGPYTASAIACFAFGAQTTVVDVNVQRVLSRAFFKCHTVGTIVDERTITRVDAAVMPSGGSYAWHQALMDIGATICTSRRPSCERCPLATVCMSTRPLELALFTSRKRIEPSIAGEPRRVWRGRIVELMRRANGAIAAGDVLNALIDRYPTAADARDGLRAALRGLAADGLVMVVADRERIGVVADSSDAPRHALDDATMLALKE